MPYNENKNLQNAKKILKETNPILLICGAGMSVDSGIHISW